MTRVTFNVDISDDRILESNEKFQLSINSTSLPNRVTVDNPNEVIVTIADNDCKLLILYVTYMINHCSYYCQLQSVNIQC